MVDRGARHFIFLSRSGADKPAAAEQVRVLEEKLRETKEKSSLQISRGDVSIRENVEKAVKMAKRPVRGVVQAAMVLSVF
jgi:hypothetical protein